jgi:hypothetical protein
MIWYVCEGVMKIDTIQYIIGIFIDNFYRPTQFLDADIAASGIK